MHYTCFIATDGNDDTDHLDDLTTGKEDMVNAFTGPIEFMNILSNLFEDQDSYDLVTDNTKDDRSQDNAIVLSSGKDEHEAFPDVNFIPLMGNPVVEDPGNVIVLSSGEDEHKVLSDVNFIPLMGNPVVQDPGMLEEIPIIEEVVISHPNEDSETHYMGDSMEPPVTQEEMVDIMEEASQFVNRMMQAMTNRFRPLGYDEWMVPGTQERNHNLPLSVVSVEWEGPAKDNAMNDVAEINQGSHGAGAEKADTPDVKEAGDRSKDVKATEKKMSSALEPKAKPEEKVLTRTERVTNPEDLPADEPTFRVVQHQKESAEGGKSEIM